MRALFILVVSLLGLLHAPGLQAQSCTAQAGANLPTLVELYTSEGCNSCPPADRWLSTLRGRPDVLALAFHVDYWDRLGWKDRFASPAYTHRQQEQLATAGAGFAYTPQVLVNGRDWRRWPGLPGEHGKAALGLSLERKPGQRLTVELTPAGVALPALRLWWATVEDGHQTQVRAGETEGSTLRHDHVVRGYSQLLNLPAGQPGQRLDFMPALTGEDGKARRLLLLATDPRSGQLLQALQWPGC